MFTLVWNFLSAILGKGIFQGIFDFVRRLGNWLKGDADQDVATLPIYVKIKITSLNFYR